MNRTIRLEFITPLFSHGATDAPEVRAPSIRGQLHDWFRILGGDIVAERRVFGGIRQGRSGFDGHDKTMASAVVVRVSDVHGSVVSVPTLPHKNGGMASPRLAFGIGTTCIVSIADRLNGLASDDEARLSAAIDAWLLMGTLGYRATRAGGSFAWSDEALPQPETRLEYEDACRNLLDEFSARAKVAVLSRAYETAERARKTVSDSIGGRDRLEEQDDLSRLNHPLGRVFGGRKTSPLRYRIVRFSSLSPKGGGASRRKTSPLRYRIVRLSDGYHIVAFWDDRSEVTGNIESDLDGAIALLAKKKPELGKQLKEAFLI